MGRSWCRATVMACTAVAAACSGSIGDGQQVGSGGTSSHPRAQGGATGSSGVGGGSVVVDHTPGPTGVDPWARNPTLALTCASGPGPHPGASPVVRLTARQYANTLRDLLPGAGVTQDLPLENTVAGFTNNVTSQTASPDLVEAYEAGARALAAKAVQQLATIAGCNPTAAADEPACGSAFIAKFGQRAFRRPLDDAEKQRLAAFFASERTTYGFKAAIEDVASAMLQSPQFAFRVELGGVASNGVAPLTGYEVANRLSYLLWDAMPDAELMTAASAGKLDSADGVAEQAMRLLADAKARDVVAGFQRQWFDLQRIEGRAAQKATAMFKDWKPDVAASMASATKRFLEHAFWDGDAKLATLLTDAHAYADAQLAPLYGVKAPATMDLVALDASQRAGLLTQVGIQAGLAHDALHAPVLRGVFVLDRLLCAPPAPPPPGVNQNLPDPPAGMPTTTRQRFEQQHESGSCRSCHKIIDGVGFAFERYDALGGYRTDENGVSVDSSTSITGTSDVDGKYPDAVALSKALARSEQVGQCVVTELFRYALSRTESEEDGCTLKPLTDDFLASGGDMRGLLTSLVRSDAFRFRSLAQ